MRDASDDNGQDRPRDGADCSGSTSARARLVDAAIDLVHDRGSRALYPEALAERMDDRVCAEQVVREFPTRDGLVAATLIRWHELHIRPLAAVAGGFGTVAFLHALLVASSGAPGIARLLISTLAATSDAEHPLSAFYGQQWAMLRRTIRGFLADDLAAGREPSTMDPAAAADQLLGLYHGLLLGSVLDDREPHATVDAFDRAASRLRHGWADAYEPEALFTTTD